MFSGQHNFVAYTVISVVSILLTCGIIYLTPLKNINVVEPSIYDQEPRDFSAIYTANTDKYLFIDVRPSDVYTRAHAVGSISMPLHTFYNTRHSLPKNGKEIVLICNEGVASGVGYSYLQHFGFFNIRRISGGLEKWIAEGLPVEGTTLEQIQGAPSNKQ